MIATKGTAAPSATVETPAAKSREDSKRIAVTVKLTPADYRRLRLLGVENRQSNQYIVEAALIAYLDKVAGK